MGGGCYWCVEAVYQELQGVQKVVSGYMGGHVDNPTYREVCSGLTGHAEVIQLMYDPAKVSYREILEIFFTVHDPTTLNRQGNDTGTSYRSAIFYLDDEQKAVALDTIADVDASGLWPGKVVTEVTPAAEFWDAEPEHQDYLLHFPNGYTCHYPRPGWTLPKRAQV